MRTKYTTAWWRINSCLFAGTYECTKECATSTSSLSSRSSACSTRREIKAARSARSSRHTQVRVLSRQAPDTNTLDSINATRARGQRKKIAAAVFYPARLACTVSSFAIKPKPKQAQAPGRRAVNPSIHPSAARVFDVVCALPARRRPTRTSECLLQRARAHVYALHQQNEPIAQWSTRHSSSSHGTLCAAAAPVSSARSPSAAWTTRSLTALAAVAAQRSSASRKSQAQLTFSIARKRCCYRAAAAAATAAQMASQRSRRRSLAGTTRLLP